MKNNIESLASPCSGCGACGGLCPKNAISLKMNTMGFLEAAVEDSLCVDCGLCRKVCPRAGAPSTVALASLTPYALQSTDPQVLRASASGGVGHALAELALSRGEKVVGVAYDYQTNRAKHIILDQAGELPRLAGSKYLQSDPQEAFAQVLTLAKSEKLTVFGTPCQITGLAKAAALAGIRENLLLVELFCHGVPSYKLWQSQLGLIEKKLGTSRFDSLKFRDKTQGWHSYRLEARAGGKTYTGSRENTRFWLAFFEDVLLGPACRSCTARLAQSAGDIRIGDYWGSAFRSRADGVSLVFAPTPGGQAAVAQLLAAGLVKKLPATDGKEALKYQNMALYPADPAHDRAMEALKKGQPVEAVIQDYRRRQSPKKKLKRTLLRASGLLPPGLRRGLKKLRTR